MKHLYVVALSFFVLTSHAQNKPHKNLQELVDAEYAFINMAKEKNTRDAFIYHLAGDAVTFNPTLTIGKKQLEEQKPDTVTWLYWKPAYSDIASSGDFGFNTGLWEFRRTRRDTVGVAFGHFVSVWQKQPDGEWKVAIDIGIPHKKPEQKLEWSTSKMPLKPSKKKTTVDFKTIMDLEKQFIESYNEKGEKAYDETLSSEARIYRHGKLPALVNEKLHEDKNGKFSFTPVDGKIASSGDMAFVYGSAKKEMSPSESKEGNYARIWKKENGKDWKIVLDIFITN